jgi:hypothetical protein
MKPDDLNYFDKVQKARKAFNTKNLQEFLALSGYPFLAGDKFPACWCDDNLIYTAPLFNKWISKLITLAKEDKDA